MPVFPTSGADLPDYAAALTGRHLGPGAVLEGPTGGGDGGVDIFYRRRGYFSDGLFGGRVDGRERLAPLSVAELAVDKEPVRRRRYRVGNLDGHR